MCAATKVSPLSSQTTAKSERKPCSRSSHVRSSPRPPGASCRPIAMITSSPGNGPDCLQDARRLGRAGERALHVGAAAAVDRAVLDPGGLVRDRHRVEMAVEDDARPRLAAAQAADHDRRRREHLVEHLDLHPDLLEPLRVPARDLGRVAGRALDLDELEGEIAEAVGVDVLDHRVAPRSGGREANVHQLRLIGPPDRCPTSSA